MPWLSYWFFSSFCSKRLKLKSWKEDITTSLIFARWSRKSHAGTVIRLFSTHILNDHLLIHSKGNGTKLTLQAYIVEGIFYSSSAPSIQILMSFLSLFTKENLSFKLFTGGPVFRRAIANAHPKHYMLGIHRTPHYFFCKGSFHFLSNEDEEEHKIRLIKVCL